MSIARVTTVQRARKDQGVCEKCKTPLPAGSTYRHYTVGFRSHYKHVRCMSHACTPRPSELESSKLSAIYAAQEDAHDTIDAATDLDELTEAVQEVANVCREIADEYREAAQDANGNVFNYEADERADTLESAADDLESFEPSVTLECENCDGEGTVEDPCFTCDGRGVTNDLDGTESDCEDCEGSGTVDAECQECGGTGTNDDALEDAREEAREAINSMEV